ncbi:MAG: beta-ketoacyl-ACP synthase III [Schaedlerella sp.]|nr:beta-ketoacyl-ACP synthase III [Schaedlerella sp.]
MRGKICGTGSYVPEHFYDNFDLTKMVKTSDEWIQERTGIVRRHIAQEDTTVSMAVKAAQAALENCGMDAKELDMILAATMTPNRIVPGIACEVQKEIQAEKAVCMDLNAACSGFVFAYNTAQAYIATGICQKILIIGSESLSNIVNWEDRGSCILFGDGAGAVILKSEEGELLSSVMHSDGSKGDVLVCESRHQKDWKEREEAKETYLYMDGQGVFKFAVKKVPEVIGELLEKVDCLAEEIDWFILHQANRRIIESVSKRMMVGIEKFPMNLQEYGNTSSASIPILMDELNRSGKLKKGDKLVLAGFGAGLSWGAVLVEW